MTPEDGADRGPPAIVGGEKETLLAFLGYLRISVDRKLDGLSEADARRALVASGTTLLGLVKHLAFVEVYWSQRRFVGTDVAMDGDGFGLEATDTVSSVRRAYSGAGRRTDEIVTGCADLEQPMARGRRGLTLRWMLTHLVEETARHAGHADILREFLDGRTGL
jgi:Protein of unknown function (DUF664)